VTKATGPVRGSAPSPRQQFFRAMQSDIISGALSRGEPLPSHIDLSRSSGISHATVQEVMGELEALGLVETRPGRGTFVSGDAEATAALNEAADSFVFEATYAGWDVETILALVLGAHRQQAGTARSLARYVPTKPPPVPTIEIPVDDTVDFS
jgi:DNA-binding FadR family transcriptional regulator